CTSNRLLRCSTGYRSRNCHGRRIHPALECTVVTSHPVWHRLGAYTGIRLPVLANGHTEYQDLSQCGLAYNPGSGIGSRSQHMANFSSRAAATDVAWYHSRLAVGAANWFS